MRSVEVSSMVATQADRKKQEAVDFFRSRGLLVDYVVAVLIMNVVGWGIGTAASPGPWNAVVLLVGVVSTGFAVWRVFRVSACLDDEGVLIKNYWRTYRLSWEDITSLRDTVIWIGASPVDVLAFASDRRRLFAKVLATAGGRRARREFLRMIELRPEAAHVAIKVDRE
jgi:F0F1-type ATP synthase assembly protein I